MGNSVIDMYTKCGSIEDAQIVFNRMSAHNVLFECHDFGTCEMWTRAEGIGTISANAMGSGGAKPCYFIGVLNACASIMELEEGRHVHEQIVQCGFESDVIMGSSLIDMYAKCGSIDHAQSPSNSMPTCNVVS